MGYVSVTDPNNSLYRYTNYENTLEAIREKLVNRLGGYLRLRHVDDQLILDWVSIEQYGSYSTQPIEFGLTLLDYSETTSAEDVVTALIPFGATLEGESEIEALEMQVDITSVNDGKNYVFSQDAVDQFGWVWATNTWDDVTVPANLKAKAEEWLSSTQFETMSLTLTAADLSELGHDYEALRQQKVTRSFQADVMECFMTELMTLDASLPVRYSDRLWLNLIDRVTVYEDGKLLFRFKNGTEITETL